LQIQQSQTGSLVASSAIAGPGTGLGSATGVARDAAGNVYVANQGFNQIVVFPPALAGNVPPKSQISGALTGLN
jgi:glucokinase